MKTIENTKTKFNEGVEVEASIQMTASEDTVIDYTKAEDGKILILFDGGSSEKTVKILKGNAIQGTRDMEVLIPASKETALVVESGRFVNAYGIYRGKLLMRGDAKVRVIELP